MRLDPAGEKWMSAPETSAVMEALAKGGGEARFVGGAVRNALLAQPVIDVDIATPLPPEEVTHRLEDAGLAVVPTGIEHGTVTAIANGRPFEITTLRRDVTTDGRRATVAFTADWMEDASRRDFTMNALYATPDGEIFDYYGGLFDLQARRVRFVGDPVTRIREDYLRILRLFRFHAWYGAGALDEEALAAAIAERPGLHQLSGERIGKELLRLLEAPDPVPALRVMVSSGITSEILPIRLDLSRMEQVVAIDGANGFEADSLLRLAALLPPDHAAVKVAAARLKLSHTAGDRLARLAVPRASIGPELPEPELRKAFYGLNSGQPRDMIRLEWAKNPRTASTERWLGLLRIAEQWDPPRFPISGRDVIAAGVPEGPKVGRVLRQLETWWIENDFPLDRARLMQRLNEML